MKKKRSFAEVNKEEETEGSHIPTESTLGQPEEEVDHHVVKKKKKKNKNKTSSSSTTIQQQQHSPQRTTTTSTTTTTTTTATTVQPNQQEVSNTVASNDSQANDDYPYPVDSDDHCETPIEAYGDLLPLLTILAQSMNQPVTTLQIYDPFYCEGSMVDRLRTLGLENVYNKKEDFYTVIAEKRLPPHDVLVTNPPYSQDHMERLFDFVMKTNKPFCLLLPNYVYMKDYVWKKKNCINRLFFIVPNTRYQYTTPKGRRQAKSAKYTSPFPSFWYCGNFSKQIMDSLSKLPSRTAVLARNSQTIPLTMAPDQDPRKKKLRNSDKRKKHKQRKKQQQQTTA